MPRRLSPTVLLVVWLLSSLWAATAEAASLTLAWDPPQDSNVAGYVIRYGTASQSYTSSVDVGLVTTFTVDSLADGVTYYFAVQAYNSENEFGPLSNEVSGTAGLAAPRNLAAVVAGSAVNLTWSPPGGTVTGYRIEVGTGSGQSNVATINTGTATTYTLNGLAPGTYYIRVRSMNGASTSAASNEVVATVSGSSPLGAPTQLTATVRSGTVVDLSWRAPSGTVTGYRVEVGSSSGQSNVRTVNIGASTAYSLTGLSAGTYYIRVRALNGSSTSPPSNEVTARLEPTPTPPTNLTATVRENRYVDLRWQAPSGSVTGYRIEVGRSTGQSDVTTINTGTATTYTINNLTTGTYYIRMRSVTSSGTSAPSNEVTVTLGTTSGPSPPVNLRANVRNGTVVTLTWGAPSTAVDSYRIEIGTAPNRSDVRTTTVGSSVRSVTISDLRGGPYYIQVRSVRGTRTSPSSNGVQVLCAPSAPSNLSAAARGRSAIDLTWRAPSSGASEYRIEVGSAAGRSDLQVVTTATTSFTLGDLSAGTYYIRVRARNAAGTSGASNEVTATLAPGGGGRPATPANLTATREGNTINLRWQSRDSSTQFYRIELGTAPGKTDISSFTTGVTTSFSIAELPARTYYVRVRAGNDQGWSDPTPDVTVPGMGGTDAPQRLAGSASANGMVRLMWDEPQDASALRGYLVEAGSGPGRSDLARVPTTSRRLVGGPVPPGTYFVRVRSVTAAGLGSASNEVVLNVGAPQACVAPPGVPKFTAEALGTHVKLSWAPGAGDAPTSYLLDVGTTHGQRDIISVPLRPDMNTLTAPVPNGSYALRLIAVNACGASAWGAEATVTVGSPPIARPGAPSGLAAQVNGRAIGLTWAPPVTGGPVASYVIEVVAPNGAVLLALDTRNASTAFTHGAVPPGQYRVRVRAVNASGAGDPSTPIVVTVQ